MVCFYREGSILLAINIFVILLFIGFGISFSRGKGINLIAGYNTMSEREKAKLNQKALCSCMAKMMFCLAGTWVVLTIGLQTGRMWLFWVGSVLFLGVIIFFLIYMNTGNRLKN